MFVKLGKQGLGPGEAAAVAAAVCRGYPIAIDDIVAQKRARALASGIEIVTTKDVMLDAIMAALITVNEADQIKGRWHSYFKFHMPGFSSFSELLN